MESKASQFRIIPLSLPAPPSTYSKAKLGSFLRARVRKSWAVGNLLLSLRCAGKIRFSLTVFFFILAKVDVSAILIPYISQELFSSLLSELF